MIRVGPCHPSAPSDGKDHSQASASPSRWSWNAAYRLPLSGSTATEGKGGVNTMKRSLGTSLSSMTASLPVAVVGRAAPALVSAFVVE